MSLSVFLVSGERGRGADAGEQMLLLPLPLRIQRKKKTHSAVQNSTILGFFFLNSG
jgi:hypothetical protein